MNNAIKDLVNAEVMKAAFHVQNRNADGSINWNYVDADAYMAVREVFGKSDAVMDEFYKHFDLACEIVEFKIANS